MAGRAAAQEVICALRRTIARIEGTLLRPAGLAADAAVTLRRLGVPQAPLRATGSARLDAALGGFPLPGLIELRGAATRESGAVAGFALALAGLAAKESGRPLLWVATAEMVREAGRPYAPGLAERFGILPGRLLLAEAEKLADVLWIAEEAAGLGTLAAVVLEIRGNPSRLDLTATRRLHRRALVAGRPLLLLRQAGAAEPTAAPVRLAVAPAAAGPRLTLAGPLAGSIGPPAFRLCVEKSRTSPPLAVTLEWSRDAAAFEERDHDPAATNLGALAAAPVPRTDLPPALREVVALPHAAWDAASGGQPARGQYAAHRRARRAR